MKRVCERDFWVSVHYLPADSFLRVPLSVWYIYLDVMAKSLPCAAKLQICKAVCRLQSDVVKILES